MKAKGESMHQYKINLKVDQSKRRKLLKNILHQIKCLLAITRTFGVTLTNTYVTKSDITIHMERGK